MEKNLVRDWMSSNPITANPNTTLPEAYWLMINNGIRRLLVVNEDKLLGIVTLEDLRQKIPFTTFAIDPVRASDMLANCPIQKVMSAELKTITADTPLEDAAKRMIANHISSLPVMDGDKLVGIITESDIFRALVKLLHQK